jgi:hypothetical protein
MAEFHSRTIYVPVDRRELMARIQEYADRRCGGSISQAMLDLCERALRPRKARTNV